MIPYQSFNTTTNSTRIFDVPLGKYYYCLVASSQWGKGNQSAVLYVRVEDIPLPTTVLELTLTPEGHLVVTWQLITLVDGYIAYMSSAPINENTTLSSMTSSPILNSHVKNYTFYNVGYGEKWFFVVTVNATGRGNWSNIEYFNREMPSRSNRPMQILITITVVSIAAIVGITLWKFYKERKYSPDRLLEKYV
jgi:hypothetical protein